jgi:hypothetical protein
MSRVEVVCRFREIESMLAAIDSRVAEPLVLETDPASQEAWDRWRNEWPAEDLVAAWVAAKQVQDALRLIVGELEKLSCEAMDGRTVVVDERTWKPSNVAKRSYDPEQKSRLRDTVVMNVARKVALDPLTGELDSDRARIARETVDELDRWVTVDVAKVKQGPVKASGMDLGEYGSVRWVQSLREVPQ